MGIEQGGGFPEGPKNEGLEKSQEKEIDPEKAVDAIKRMKDIIIKSEKEHEEFKAEGGGITNDVIVANDKTDWADINKRKEEYLKKFTDVEKNLKEILEEFN